MSDKDGGLAFPGVRVEKVFFTPVPLGMDQSQAFTWTDTRHPGMSLRDYFAGQALTTIVIRGHKDGGPIREDDAAIAAYAYADAMLKERAK